jgi:two-component system response regulator
MNQDNSHKARILVIEDNPADVELLRMALRHAGLDCELTIIDDGADALALVSRQPPASAADLDLAIIDLNLPKHGGEEILEALRANPDLTDLPVAILTSSSSTRDVFGMHRLRVGRYIVKPPDLDAFLKIGFTVKELLTESTSSN